MQSPSGRTWPTTQMVSLLRMTSKILWITCLVLDSEIKFCLAFGFVVECLRLSVGWRGALKFFDDFEHPVAAHHRIVHDKMQARNVFEENRFGHQVLDARAVLLQQS